MQLNNKITWYGGHFNLKLIIAAVFNFGCNWLDFSFYIIRTALYNCTLEKLLKILDKAKETQWEFYRTTQRKFH